jgi:integrase/recombinase XerD
VKSPVKLYIRVRLPDGLYPYIKAAFGSNGRFRPHYAIHEGRAIHCPNGTYYLRDKADGKRVWEAAGK